MTNTPSGSAADAKARLLQEQRRINEEIAAYPGPIPACDAYFNSLLEERGRIADALQKLDAASAKV